MASYDLAVIGAGPGGYVAAIKAAQLGAKVLLIERDEVGGVCLNRGCIPTKSLIASAHTLSSVRNAGAYGIAMPEGVPVVDLTKVQLRKEAIVAKLRDGILALLAGRGIDLTRGVGSLAGPGKVRVGGQTHEAKYVLIATGSTWVTLPELPIDGTQIVTTDEALSWQEAPRRLLIVGGGVIGCEFACMMQSFGSQVTIVEATRQILPVVEGAIARLLARSMKGMGTQIFTETTVAAAAAAPDGVRVALSNGSECMADKVLVAVGRRPLTSGLHLETAGVALTERGAIRVDGRFATSAPGVYAVGDVIGQPMLAHAASAAGIAAVEGMFGEGGSFDASCVPNPIFTSPEIGAVGQTSEELKRQGREFLTGRFPYAACGKALCDGEEDGQAIVHTDMEGKILGVHIIGRDATLLIPEAALAIRKGMTAKELEATIHAHPTLSEIMAEAAADVYGTAIHKMKAVR